MRKSRAWKRVVCGKLFWIMMGTSAGALLGACL